MQLVVYGAQDIYLTGNPQITFFKIVYRRHTNFAIETIEHQFNGEPGFDRRVTLVFTRDGDLLTKIYLKIVLGSVDPNGNNFAWVRRIGHALIDSVEAEIGGTIIDRQSGTWLDIWYELARTGDHERGYAHMVGDIPELTAFNSDIKQEFTLFVPLQFWFNRHTGLAIPLIALQYHDVRIHVRFALRENVIIKDCNFDDSNVIIQDATILANYVYLDSDERRRFAQAGHEYLIEQTQFNGVERVESLITRYTLDYNHPTKEIIWAMKQGNYLLGQAFLFYTHRDSWIDKGPDGSDSAIELAACKLILESISVGTDPTDTAGGTWSEIIGLTIATIGTINVTNNTIGSVWVNSQSVSIGDYGITDKIAADVVVDEDGTVNCNSVTTTLTVRDLSFPVAGMIDSRHNACDPLVNQFNNYGILIDGSVNPIQSALLQLNGHDRFDEREGTYFNNVQPEKHHSNTPADGINVYSFALFPEQHQPSGTANMSRIDDSRLTIRFLDSTQFFGAPALPFLNTDNELYIYGTNYNILRILAGLAGIAYSTG